MLLNQYNLNIKQWTKKMALQGKLIFLIRIKNN